MPVYDFECKECEKKYDALVSISNATGNGIPCPYCGSKKKDKLMSVCSIAYGNPQDGDKWSNSHDYRYGYTLEKAQEQRRAAEKASHMGTEPYNPIDDLNVDSTWGKVK